MAKERAGVITAKLVKYHRPLEHVGSPYAQTPAPPAASGEINLLQLNVDVLPADQPGFYYLWDPSVW